MINCIPPSFNIYSNMGERILNIGRIPPPNGSTAQVGLGLLYGVPGSHSIRHITIGKGSSGRAIGPSQRPLTDDTQHSQETGIHVPERIRTRNPSKRAVAATRIGNVGCSAFQHTDFDSSPILRVLHINQQ